MMGVDTRTGMPLPRPLTARQSLILEFIRSYQEANGYPPTQREIGEKFGIRSTNGVSDHLTSIARKGFISVEFGAARAIRILEPTTTKPSLVEELTDLAAENERLRDHLRNVRDECRSIADGIDEMFRQHGWDKP